MTCTKSQSFPFFLPMVLFCPRLSRTDLSAVDSEAGSCSEAASLSTWHRSPHFTRILLISTMHAFYRNLFLESPHAVTLLGM